MSNYGVSKNNKIPWGTDELGNLDYLDNLYCKDPCIPKKRCFNYNCCNVYNKYLDDDENVYCEYNKMVHNQFEWNKLCNHKNDICKIFPKILDVSSVEDKFIYELNIDIKLSYNNEDTTLGYFYDEEEELSGSDKYKNEDVGFGKYCGKIYNKYNKCISPCNYNNERNDYYCKYKATLNEIKNDSMVYVRKLNDEPYKPINKVLKKCTPCLRTFNMTFYINSEIFMKLYIASLIKKEVLYNIFTQDIYEYQTINAIIEKYIIAKDKLIMKYLRKISFILIHTGTLVSIVNYIITIPTYYSNLLSLVIGLILININIYDNIKINSSRNNKSGFISNVFTNFSYFEPIIPILKKNPDRLRDIIGPMTELSHNKFISEYHSPFFTICMGFSINDFYRKFKKKNGIWNSNSYNTYNNDLIDLFEYGINIELDISPTNYKINKNGKIEKI